MAVIFTKCDPKALLKEFQDKIKQKKAEGKINTWEENAGNFTHTSRQWNQQAFFKPIIGEELLEFSIVRPQGKKISDEAYAYYHGHLIQTFLTHFGGSFKYGAATGTPTKDDLC